MSQPNNPAGAVVIDAVTHQKAVEDFSDFMSVILPPPNEELYELNNYIIRRA